MQNKLNVLVLGSGAREHAIAEAILKSPFLDKLFLADANDGFSTLGEKVNYTNYENLAQICLDKKIDLAVIGSEDPLCQGIADIFKQHNISCIGVDKIFSRLEGSKLFGKKFMEKYAIKTAKYYVITKDTKVSTLYNYFDDLTFPLVIKADGLCKGKGVKIVYEKDIAMTTIVQYLNGKFGESSKTILIEEFLEGDEISLMSLWDGKNLLHFPLAKDFKKLNHTLNSPNTGGMGAFCPVELTDIQQKKLDEYKAKLKHALTSEKADFIGFIYSGLILTQDEIKDLYVLEYNVRLGDPEAQVILKYLKTDLLEILKFALEKNLHKIKLEYSEGISACLTLACEGYPDKPKDGEKINFPKKSSKFKDIKIFYAGVEKNGNDLYSKGGRILSLCTISQKPFKDLKIFANEIKMGNKYFRNDLTINENY